MNLWKWYMGVAGSVTIVAYVVFLPYTWHYSNDSSPRDPGDTQSLFYLPKQLSLQRFSSLGFAGLQNITTRGSAPDRILKKVSNVSRKLRIAPNFDADVKLSTRFQAPLSTLLHIAVNPTTIPLHEQKYFPRSDCTEQGCSQVLYPGPTPAPRTSMKDLPLYPAVCLGNTSHASSIPVVTAFKRTTLDQCRSACVDNTNCVSFTHGVAGVKHTDDSGQAPCTLYGTFVHDKNELTRGKHKECTTGLVRAGFFGQRSPGRDTLAGQQQYDHGQSPRRIEDIDLAVVGKCTDFVCLDVHHCSRRMQLTGKRRYAIVTTDDLRRSADPHTAGKARGARNLMESASFRRRVRVSQIHGIDHVLVVPADPAALYPLTAEEHAFLAAHGVVVHKVDWVVPPRMRHKLNQGCGYMDFIRLHTLNLTAYDAVILFDADVAVVGDLTPVLRCAAQDYMLSTTGPNSPMNLGFVAFKPDARLLAAALHFAEHVEYDKPPRGSSAARRSRGGWDNIGFEPSRQPYIGGECGQGFMFALYFSNGFRNVSTGVEAAWRHANRPRPRAHQLDRCTWNYQAENTRLHCADDFRCGDARSIHKAIVRRPVDPQQGKGCFYKSQTKSALKNTINASSTIE
eukprot:m.403015 g.403015  ORF g.403015 m.403015 type:complete len:623 (-) comp21189_c0_seq2:325-2193(-)